MNKVEERINDNSEPTHTRSFSFFAFAVSEKTIEGSGIQTAMEKLDTLLF